jgi:TPP-dependent pyruvate/acetoin dehydrogenase alpha subunit
VRYRKVLEAKKQLADQADAKIRDRAGKAVNDAVQWAMSCQEAPAQEALDDVYE